MLSAKAPRAVTFDEDEIEEVVKAQAMLLLHMSDVEIDAMNPRMVAVALQVAAANDEIKAWHIERQHRHRGQ